MTSIPEFPNAQRRVIEIVKSVAVEKGCRPYIVGGPVRDLLLGRPAFDMDLTLEDDSSSFARALAKQIGGRVKSFPQFLTYKVIADQMPEIDIATARKERYRSPGALPTVTAGKLRDDLMRRDFSINAVALDLVEGTLHDPTGGVADLRARVVRVLHERSFIDDPTRIYRALRLATRLGFHLAQDTRRLLAEAVRGGALETVSRERIWRELFLAMDEEQAPEILAQFAAHHALEILFGRARLDRRLLDAAKKQVDANKELDRYVLFTSALLHGDASPVDLEGSGFSQKRARNVVQIANELPRFTDSLSEAKSERQRLRLLKHASPEMLSVLAAVRPDESEYVARFHQFQNFKLPLRGNDLEVPGGPHVARALERTREAVFTGEIPVAEARTFARELAAKYLREHAEGR